MMKATDITELHVCEIGRDEWDKNWPNVHQANLMQSWEYGDAKNNAEAWKPIRLLIRDAEDNPIALAQVLTRTLPIIGGIARLNRGPLLLNFFANTKNEELIRLACLKLIFDESRRRRWWIIQVAPEFPMSAIYIQGLQKMGVRHRPNVPWGSIRLSLLPNIDDLFMGLKSKWRNMLRKAQKSGLTISCNNGKGAEIYVLIQRYKDMQRAKGFAGVSESLLKNLIVQDGPAWNFCLYVASELNELSGAEEIVGFVVSVVHGDSATYLIGNTNEIGRNKNANYLLLWEAIIDAKSHGCSWFDLGGVNAKTPSGVAKFKQGIQGESYNLIGEWRKYNFL